jgi:hypothetical protein
MRGACRPLFEPRGSHLPRAQPDHHVGVTRLQRGRSARAPTPRLRRGMRGSELSPCRAQTWRRLGGIRRISCRDRQQMSSRRVCAGADVPDICVGGVRRASRHSQPMGMPCGHAGPGCRIHHTGSDQADCSPPILACSPQPGSRDASRSRCATGTRQRSAAVLPRAGSSAGRAARQPLLNSAVYAAGIVQVERRAWGEEAPARVSGRPGP